MKTIFLLLGIHLILLNSFAYELNHATLAQGHVTVAEDFIIRNFQENGTYDSQKLSEFIDRLEKEYEALKSDIYETAIIEAVDVHIIPIEEARKYALKEIKDEKHELLYVFKNYLLPSAHDIKDLIDNSASLELIEGAVDKFIELYHVYYIPELPRNRY